MHSTAMVEFRVVGLRYGDTDGYLIATGLVGPAVAPEIFNGIAT